MIISLVLKATAILVIGLGAARLAQAARASVRHAMLFATFAALALLPLAAILVPAVTINVAVPTIDAAADVTEAVPVAPAEAGAYAAGGADASVRAARPAVAGFSPRITITSALFSVWLAGALLCLGTVATGVWRVQRIRRTALPALALEQALAQAARNVAVRVPLELLVHEQLSAPIACGVTRPAVVLPPDAQQWDAAALQRALVHELEHVKRRDWLTQLFALAICAIYWFHPLAWLAHRRLCLYAEHACDDAVVAQDDGATYAEQLVTLARRMAAGPSPAVLGMAQRTDLSARVTAVLDETKVRGRAGVIRAAVIATTATALLAVLAPLTVAATTAPAQAPGLRSENRVRVAWRDRALVEAVDRGSVAEVRELLDEGANVNAIIDGDGSPLIVAAREGHLELVTLLLDRGADVNLAVGGDGAPLIMAAREGHLPIVQLLLDRGGDVELVVPGDENALIQASGEGHLAVAKLLVSRGANVNARVLVEGNYTAIGSDARGPGRWDARLQEWRTPLSEATRRRHSAVIEFLRSAGAVE